MKCKECGREVKTLFGGLCVECYTKITSERMDWVMCPQCGNYWTSLTDEGICYDCRKKKHAKFEKDAYNQKNKQEQNKSIYNKIVSFAEKSMPKEYEEED